MGQGGEDIGKGVAKGTADLGKGAAGGGPGKGSSRVASGCKECYPYCRGWE